MKGLRIGRRRGRDSDATLSPLELALRPALVEGRWQIPDRFNFTRDVVEALARDPKRRALTFIGSDGIIEPRTFRELSEGANVWAVALREQNVGAGDRVVVMAPSTVDWLEAILGIWKIGGVFVPCLPTTTSSQLERIISSTDAALVVAERSLEPIIQRMGFTPDVHLYEEGTKRNSKDVPANVPTHDTASRDLAFVVSTTGVGGARKDVAHTHGSIFATRVQAEHWLDVGRGDTVWCTADAASPLTIWNTVVGPWSRGAEVALHHGEFDADERLDLLFRLGASILCQSPAEYRALAEHRRLERFRSPRLRRLVSTGDYLDPEVIAVFEERWGMSIADGYGQAETNIVVANLADGAVKPGSVGRALPGHHVAVIDDQGNELPPGIEGDLAVRGRPPTLFAGYWELPEETKSAFLGDWYLSGDVAAVDEEGFFTFVARSEDVISSNGRTFGPHDIERVLEGHPALAAAAVVGIRDLQRGGHFLRAFVVARNPVVASEQHEAELREYVAQTLPGYQVPREIVFVDELPRLSWKVSRYELRERPLPMRPLWENPPAEDEADVGPAPLDGEFSPRVPPEPASASLAIPEIVVPEPAPEAVTPPLVDATPTDAPIASPEPPAPQPDPEPEPIVAEAVPAPEPAADPEPEPQGEPAPEEEPDAVEPLAEALPDPEPAPEPEAAQPVAPEPEPRVVEPLAEALPAPEPEPEPHAAGPAPTPDAELELELQLESEADEDAREPDESDSEAASAASVDTVAQLAVVEPEELPGYVVAEPAELPPVQAAAAPPEPETEPETEPELSGPPPEYVVETEANVAPVLHLEQALGDEEEEDLGPLPDYVIDPNDPEAARKHVPPPPPPEPRPILAPRQKGPDEQDAPATPALNFPSSASFTLPSGRAGSEAPREPRAPRARPQVDLGKARRPAEPAEPGDEASEVGWMAGLSNRLSAYSLSEEEESAARDADDDES